MNVLDENTGRVARASELIGKPVFTLDEAVIVGELRDVLIDPLRSAVIGFSLRGRGLLSSPLLGILPLDGVHAIGRDALTISSADQVITERAGMSAMLERQEDVIGKEALSASGSSLGTITDVVLAIDGAHAAVAGYELAPPAGPSMIVPVTEPVAISTDALVMPDDAAQQPAPGLASFRETLVDTGDQRR